jgi:hypothetical protein
MDLSTLANLINAFAVTAGVIFAAVQIRYYRQQRRREAMLELVKSFQSPAFTSALRRVLSLPDGADAKKIHEVLGPDGEDAVYMVSLTWESLGLLVFRREVTLDLVGDFLVAQLLPHGESYPATSRNCAGMLSEIHISNGSNGWRSD